jgi:hypothetical protein
VSLNLSKSLNASHYRKLDEVRSAGCGWPGAKSPQSWGQHVGVGNDVLNSLPSERLGRPALKAFCSDPKNAPEACFTAVMAWGGMKVNHGQRVWRHQQEWSSIVQDLRNGRRNRTEGYEAFRRFRAKNPGCGMGPAYFTKLIYFCHPTHDGYIMDQWTSLSVNLLFSVDRKPIINMISSFVSGRRSDTVSDNNSPETYETYCQCIELLARMLNVSEPDVVEEWVFSRGGRNPAPWRKYLKEHRPL